MSAVREPATEKNGRRRDLASLTKLSRKPVLSTARKAADPKQPLTPGEKPPHRMFRNLKAFLPSNLWKWAKEYFRHRFGFKHVFQTYPNPASDNGIYRVKENFTVAMASDWGTGTDEAAAVATQMLRTLDPDITIHLGDVYYVGAEDDVRENCLGQKSPETKYDPVTWPHGRIGSFALNANHEMYARGMAYYDVFLPTLGIYGKKQGASFFCIENDSWRLIALDTGYNSVGIPILEHIPIINRIRWIGGNCAQEPDWIEWLANTVRPEQDKRALILLSHHNYYSAFEDERNYPKPAQQLARYIKRPVLWFWGHEHRLAAYDAHQRDGGITAIGRCIGHGGMPIERNPEVLDKASAKVLRFVDNRPYDSGEGIDVGFNGFANLTFEKESLKVRYLDLQGQEALFEEWTSYKGLPTLVTFRPTAAQV